MMPAQQTPALTPISSWRIYFAGWGVIMAIVLAPWLWLATEKNQPPAQFLVDPAVVAAQSLWSDDRVLSAAWAEQVRQWPKVNVSSSYASLPLLRAWSDLDASALALLERAPQVLQVQQIQRAHELLEAHTNKGHPEIQRLGKLLQSRMQSLLSKPATSDDVPILVLRFKYLDSVIDDLNQIQLLLNEVRRWSNSRAVASEDKLPLSFYVQMSRAFPTVNVRLFEEQAFLLIKSRLIIENALFQTQLRQWMQHSAEPEPPSLWRWTLALLCALVAAGWLLLLGRGLAQYRQQHAKHTNDLRALEIKLQEALANPPDMAPAATIAKQNSEAESAWASQVQASIPDLLGRLKNIQRLFDSGYSQELVACDLAIVEAKLAQWDQSLQDVAPRTPGTQDV